MPPVLTKTWYHTGADLPGSRLAGRYAREYFGAPAAAPVGASASSEAAAELSAWAERELLPDAAVLSDGADDAVPGDGAAAAGLTASEVRQAARALRGVVLRQEVYGLDGTARQDVPYWVSDRSYTVRCRQRQAHQRDAVFDVHHREDLTRVYERDDTDPRREHRMTLEVDPVGNVLRSVAVAYGRRAPALAAEEDRRVQGTTLITCTQAATAALPSDRFPDDHLVPRPVEERTFELTGFLTAGSGGAAGGSSARFTVGDWTDPDGIGFTGLDGTPITSVDGPDGPGPRRRLLEHTRTLFRRDDLTGPLPPGALEPLALPFESYRLAFTGELLDAVYAGRVSDAVLRDEGGYTTDPGAPGWWLPSGRAYCSPNTTDSPSDELAHARRHFFLTHRFRDAFHTPARGTETLVAYDAHDLLITGIRDAVGNETRAVHDYRVLRPRLLTDANGNRTEVAFDALGLVTGTAVMGRPAPAPVEGDSLDGFESDPGEQAVRDYLADPTTHSAQLLGAAGTRVAADLLAYYDSRGRERPQPAVVATLARETHAADPAPADGLQIQHSLAWSDGFGREVQHKVLAEPGRVPRRAPDGTIEVDADGRPQLTTHDAVTRWACTGWTVFDDKGRPVRQYEPFFTDRSDLEPDVRVGVSRVLVHDPLGRVVANLYPDHTYDKVVVDAWSRTTFDRNDTVLSADGAEGDPLTDPDVAAHVGRDLADRPAGWRTWHADRMARPANDPDRGAAVKAAAHAGTPTTEHHDVRGRAFVTVTHDGFDPVTSGPRLSATRASRDAAGHVRVVRDADTRGGNELGRVVARYAYDLVGRRVLQVTIDEGERWVLPDAAGQAVRTGDGRSLHRSTFDALHRPTEVHVTVAETERLAERTTYGEALGSAGNHRGRVHQVFDAVGVLTHESYDFKGNLLADRRELLADERTDVDWRTSPPGTGGTFTSSATFDAMNRPTSITAPDGTLTTPRCNAANLLQSLTVRVGGTANDTVYVAAVDYDARGRRTEIRLGNGARTRYEYDPLTSRLRRLTTTRPDHGDQLAPIFSTAAVVQDLRLTYDPVGNVTQVEDVASVTVFHAGAQVRPVSEYTYDARYRLVAAGGREHIGQTALDLGPPPGPARDTPFLGGAAHPHDLGALRRYTEDYAYDPGGNLESLRHSAAGGTWTRHFRCTEASRVEPGVRGNRLTATGLGDGFDHVQTFTYTDATGQDTNGSMTSLGGTTLEWDAENRLRRATLVDGDTVTYAYDASGRRRRAVRRSASGTLREGRIYLDGLELHRRYDATGAVVSERRTLHVMDDRHRLALVVLPEPASAASPAVRYQLGDHLDSAVVELDDAGRLLSYEEYHPFGTTSFRAAGAAETSLKRYRFTGKERDEETGLAYHGARYYAPWLGRWSSCDPAGLTDGLNAYVYARSRPTTGTDPNGRETVTIPEVTVEGRRPDQVAADIQARTGVRAYALAKALGITPGETTTWVSNVEERIDAFVAGQTQAQAAAGDYAGPAVGVETQSADVLRSQRQARDREEYLQEHPNLRSVLIADAQRVGRATGPAGDSIAGAAAGAYMLQGQDPATAVQKGRVVGAIAGLLPAGKGLASQQLIAAHDAGQAWSSWAGTETQGGAPLAPSAATASATAPKLTYSQGFSLGNDLARAGYTGVFGKYPGNVQYVEAHPEAFTVDRPWGWTPMYNAGGVQGALQANGRFVFTSRTFTGTFRLEAEQVFRAGVQPEYSLR